MVKVMDIPVSGVVMPYRYISKFFLSMNLTICLSHLRTLCGSNVNHINMTGQRLDTSSASIIIIIISLLTSSNMIVTVIPFKICFSLALFFQKGM